MSQTNCKNCGAPLDIWAPKCEFCGTKNINLTALDLASGEPANFIFRMPYNMRVENQDDKEVYLSLLAVPSLETITINADMTTISGGWGCVPLVQYGGRRELEMQLKLNTVSRKSKDRDALYELRVGD